MRSSDYGIYIEFANRAYDKVEVHIDYFYAEDKVTASQNNPEDSTFTLDTKNYMKKFWHCLSDEDIPLGFRLTVTIHGKEYPMSRPYLLSDTLSTTLSRNRFYLKELGCVMLISYGTRLIPIDEEGRMEGRAYYRFEFYEAAKLRFGVMNDYHFGCDNVGDQTNKAIKIASLKYRPEFIVMPGDLLHNPTPPKTRIKKWDDYRDIWTKFIDPLEWRNIPVADGFGNHDLWEGVGATDVKKKIQNRNEDRWNGLKPGYNFKVWDTQYPNKKATKFNENQYHYLWETKLYDGDEIVEVFGIMLNNVPTWEDKEDLQDNEHKKDTYGYGALKCLEEILAKHIGPREHHVVVLLFFHINYACDQNSDIEGNPERWWNYCQKSKLRDVLNRNKDTTFVAFFGHEHNDNIKKQILYTGPRTDSKNKTEYFGYRCAKSKDTPRLNFVDLELTGTAGKHKLDITVSWIKVNDIEKGNKNEGTDIVKDTIALDKEIE